MVATTNKRVRFCNNNQITDLDSANITASSALSLFPFSNAQDDARFRVWKPAGRFTIDSTNKNIYINDGSDKTVALTEADYTYSTLATHIQTQLNASSANWTCSYSTSTNKFTIGNSGSVTLRETQTTNAAWDTLGYTDGTDHSGTSFEADESRNHTSESVVFDLGAAKAVDFFACIGQCGENLTISSSATITLKGNSVNSFSSPAVSKTLSRTDGGIFYFEDTNDMTYRYWKFEFEDKQNTVGPEGFVISNIYLGDYDTLTTTNVTRGLSRAMVDPSEEQVSIAGSKFYREKTKYWQYSSMGVLNLSQTERLALESFFQTNGRHKPFYIAIDPTNAISSTLDEMTHYVRFDGNPTYQHLNATYFNVGFALSEVI